MTLPADDADGTVSVDAPTRNEAIPITAALATAPEKIGCYILFVAAESFEALSAPLPELRRYYDAQAQVLYVGRAIPRTIRSRIEINHARASQGNSSPTKSIRALLRAGARLQGVPEPEQAEVVAWVREHVAVAWRAMLAEAVCQTENVWKRQLTPPLNLDRGRHLPQSVLDRMTELRKAFG